jgi:hypothetical protein
VPAAYYAQLDHIFPRVFSKSGFPTLNILNQMKEACIVI